MLNNKVLITPERVFYDYQKKMQAQPCQVCQNIAVGFHYGAYVCEACKKFFKRYLYSKRADSSRCEKDCDLEFVGRRKCADCRYQKCLREGMQLSVSSVDKSNFDISKIPCRICGNKSSGFHFGSLTCEGCKGFFRRADIVRDQLACSSTGDCLVSFGNGAMCKYCRYQRCIKAGMSKSGSRIGRQPNAVKYHCVLEISNGRASVTTSSENSYPVSESSSVDSSFHAINKVQSDTVSLPINAPIAPVIPYLLESQTKNLYTRIMEGIAILHMPFQNVISLLQVYKKPLDNSQSRMEVWKTMMQHFDAHSHMIIQFAKKIPAFIELNLIEKRFLVQGSMYPVILLNLSRSYNAPEDKLNYFDFSEQERGIILGHFPSMKTIMSHIITISRVVANLQLSQKQIGFLCVMELFKNCSNIGLESSADMLYQETVRLCWTSILEQSEELNGRAKETDLTETEIPSYLRSLHCPPDMIHVITSKLVMSKSQTSLQLRVAFELLTQWLEQHNREHQIIIDQLKIKFPELPYSDLYNEMFKLSAQ